jgi:Spy/CpxP family protein refolding chaperone
LKSYYSLFLFLCLCGAAFGQAPQQARDSRDSIDQELFPPELVMQYQQEINLNEGQSRAIRDEIHKAQAKFVDMQWDLQTETEKMALLLKTRPAEEGAVLAQLDKVLDRERAIKKTQISLLVRIRNLLTEAQQAKLMELRRKSS